MLDEDLVAERDHATGSGIITFRRVRCSYDML